MRKTLLKLKNKVNWIEGSTMIETLVGFLVVVMMMLMFSKVVSVSVHMLNSTQTVIDKSELFNEKVYLKNNTWKTAGMDIFYTIDTKKTNTKNGAKEIKLKHYLIDTGVKYYYDMYDTRLKIFSFYVADLDNKEKN